MDGKSPYGRIVRRFEEPETGPNSGLAITLEGVLGGDSQAGEISP
jgi:hypothetical protein